MLIKLIEPKIEALGIQLSLLFIASIFRPFKPRLHWSFRAKIPSKDRLSIERTLLCVYIEPETTEQRFQRQNNQYSGTVVLLSIIVGQVTHSQVSWSPPSDRLTRGRLSLVAHNMIQAIERLSLVERRVSASN